MRLHRAFLGVLLLGGLLLAGLPSEAKASATVSISLFQSELSPHGRWVVAASLGSVWVPAGVGPGWAPYTDGEWAYTDYGWTWVSYDPWGDIPCHYGAWSWADPYGWVWTPGTVWAPAWVTWAYTDDYVGWAPLPPSFVFSAAGYAGAPIVVAQSRYVFVPTRRFVGVRVSTVRVPEAQVVTIFPRANKVTHFQVASGVVRQAGPPRAQVERAVGRPIAPARVDQVKTAPTTLAQAGFTKASHVPVVAPAAERNRVAPVNEARAEKPRAEKPAASNGSRDHQPISPKSEAAPERSSATAHTARETKEPLKHDKPATSHSADGTNSQAHSSRKPQPQGESKPAPAQPEKPRVEYGSRPHDQPQGDAHPAPARPAEPAHSQPDHSDKSKPAKPKPPKQKEESKPPSSDKPGA